MSKKVNNAEHGYMNIPPPPIIQFATPLHAGTIRFKSAARNRIFPPLGITCEAINCLCIEIILIWDSN